jgi:hypothetical protein
MFTNPTEFRACIEDLFDENGLAEVGGVMVSREELEGAAEELIGVLVDAYMNSNTPPSCATLLGRILLNELQTQLGT